MSDHEQGQAAGSEIILQPLGDLHVQVVGGLVQNQEIGLLHQCLGQCNPFGLASGELVYRFVKMEHAQFCKQLAGTQQFLVIGLRATCGQHVGALGEYRGLHQIGGADVTAERDGAAAVIGMSGNHVQQGALALSVTCYKTHFLALVDIERKIIKNYTVTE